MNARLTAAFCLAALAAQAAAQVYSPNALGNSAYGQYSGYPGSAYGSGLGSQYAGTFSPYGSPYGMSGYAGGLQGMNGLYGGAMNQMPFGQNPMAMMGGGGFGGSPYSRFGSPNRHPLPLPPPIQPINSKFGLDDPNCL
ncbi:hypothetical protein M3Y99_01021600 [Aphelenchoides fujianensis]|nr:hypothetical protein M3Y99_01021600 [Aphelenchoides fujianensis]